MLPSNLLRAKISRGKIRPLYASIDPETVALAERMIGLFRDGLGKRKGELLERLREVEGDEGDFKLVRGLSALLERRCAFEVDSGATDPMAARMAVFEEASRARAVTADERQAVIQRVSSKLGVSPEALERALYSDLEDELIMRDFKPLSAEPLIRRYNLSLMQTLLFKSLRVEFSASGNWKNIFREVKRQGLIYSVERDDERSGYRVSVDGPLSLFKFTERYGTSVAKLLPRITASEKWSVSAEILARSRGGRIYVFEADSEEVRGLIAEEGDGEEEGGVGRADAGARRAGAFDSTVEEKFARSFLSSYGSLGWVLRREPEPLVAGGGTHVLIPDFSFEKDGMKVYLEVVGFWTPQYLERKTAKLGSISGAVDMIVAADESLACSKLERLRTGKAGTGTGMEVIYYKNEVPLKPIVEHLKEREHSVLREQAGRIDKGSIVLKGDVVSLEDLAKERRGASLEALSLALQDFRFAGYARVGNLFISQEKLEEIDGRLSKVEKLTEALAVIEGSGVSAEDASKVLDALGYTSVWEGMEMEKVRISKLSTKGGAASKGGET
jgi:predicted nuclease of restriction endonuclease-like RecB superfamily